MSRPLLPSTFCRFGGQKVGWTGSCRLAGSSRTAAYANSAWRMQHHTSGNNNPGSGWDRKGQHRHASSSSSSRWKQRQGSDYYAQKAKSIGMSSRAGFKLLEIQEKYNILRRGQIIVDLGFAPGAWSQVAHSLTTPGNLVLGIDLIPAQPPKGCHAIQGDFLDPRIRVAMARKVAAAVEFKGLRGQGRGRKVKKKVDLEESGKGDREEGGKKAGVESETQEAEETEEGKEEVQEQETKEAEDKVEEIKEAQKEQSIKKEGSTAIPEGPYVDVVLSDMLANTSGAHFRDHIKSLDLCRSALHFAFDNLAVRGNFVCKFYQGAEDKQLENTLSLMFTKVFRLKPDSSRKESREAYFVALKRKPYDREEQWQHVRDYLMSE